MKKICKNLSLALIILLSLELMLTFAPVHAVTTTVEIINPLDGTHDFNFTTSQKSVGDTFSINLTVTDVTGLSSWQAKVTWNAALLEFFSFAFPTDNVMATHSPLYVPGDNSTPGETVGGCAAGFGGGTFTGSGTLAVLTLRITQGVSSDGLRQVQCDIAFVGLGSDTFVLDSNGFDIPFTPVNGHYTYTAPAPPPAKLFIDPPKVIDPTLTAGHVFNVSLAILNATNVGSWAADIFYSNTLLNTTLIEEGDFLKSVNTTTFTSTIDQSYNATHGVIHLSCALLSGRGDGAGTLAKMTFEVLSLGQSDITVNNVNLQDSFGLPLPFSTTNGYFNNILLAKLSMDPDLVTGPAYIPGTTFTVNVTLSGVENEKTCIFNLTYNPSIIQEIAISTPSVMGQNPIKKLQVDDGAGYIWTNLTYRNGVTTFNAVTIMTVQFQVLAMGVSPIDLTSTQLFDIADNPTVHEVHNGIFIGLIRDVAVTNTIADLQIAYQGWKVYVNVTVKNKGNATETFDVHFYYDSNLGGTTTVIGLAPDEERVMTITWNTSTAQPGHNYTITSVADPVPFEMNLADNNFTDGNIMIRLMGDVNGDGTVNMRDINQLVLVFRSYPGHPKWDPLNDLDRNGIIDMRDITLCILNFGKTIP